MRPNTSRRAARPLPCAIWLGALLLGLGGCGDGGKATGGGEDSVTEATLGGWTARLRPDGALDLEGPRGQPVEGLRLLRGTGSATVEMRVGSYRFTDVQAQVDEEPLTALRRDGEVLRLQAGAGVIELREDGPQRLRLRLQGAAADDRLGVAADCTSADHFLGAGLHAFDVDHVGEAFYLWVSEPGIGKVDSEEPPADWFTKGTRHSSSFPMPWLLRPHLNHGLLLDADGRVDLDLCHTDAGRFSMLAWDTAAVELVIVVGDDPRDVLRGQAGVVGRAPLPDAWVLGPWNDAIRGPEVVRGHAAALRAAGAPSSAIWSEDWRGAIDSPVFGYHPGPEWGLGEELYTDADVMIDELDGQGFRWLAYFAPFLTTGTQTYAEAEAAGAVLQGPDGQPSLFPGPFLEPISVVDLSGPAGMAFVEARTAEAATLGIGGWMADFAEWLPTDAALADGRTGQAAHNRYPEWWQQAHAAGAAAGDRVAFFARSGWVRTPGLAPVVWAGDQRTSWDVDDGLPSVIPMGLGAGASGVPLFTHDVGGYQSATNPPRDAELLLRWAALGAYSPILRTHHGNQSLDNVQIDSDPALLAAWAALAAAHTALLPYRMGLAADAAAGGPPALLPPALVFPADDPARVDAWMLGGALLVAPVVEPGVEGREVALPPGPRWRTWPALTPAESGWAAAPLGEIPVFLAEGSIVPLLVEAPDTTWAPAGGLDAGVVGLAEVDIARELVIFGAGGRFTEADGTTYTLVGTPTSAAELTVEGDVLDVDLGGATLQIRGPVPRSYRLRLQP